MTLETPHLDSSDRRQHRRRQTFIAGTVTTAGGLPIKCVIRNISDGGALLVLEKPQTLPYGFLLEIEGHRDIYGCEIRHHHGVKIGVEFVDTATVSDSDQNVYGGEVGQWIETANRDQLLNWP